MIVLASSTVMGLPKRRLSFDLSPVSFAQAANSSAVGRWPRAASHQRTRKPSMTFRSPLAISSACGLNRASPYTCRKNPALCPDEQVAIPVGRGDVFLLWLSAMKFKGAVLQVAAIVAVTMLVFSGSLDGEFVSDDTMAVRDNELIRVLDWAHIKGIFTTFDGANYMPLKVLSLALDYRLWGPTPFGFHMTNIAIHALAAVLVLLICLRLAIAPWAAFFVALLWSVHPLQVESVAWISERKNVLSGLFFFAAFYAYLGFSESGRWRSYFWVFVFFCMALLSKMNTMVLPAVNLAYEGTLHHRLRRRDLAASLPLFAAGAAVASYNLAGNPIHGTHYHGGSAIVTWLSSSVVVFRYLWNFLIPTNLCVYYDVPLRGTIFSLPVFASVVGLIAIGGITGWLVRKARPEAFWILWFGITLAPMLNIVPFRSLMNDRYMYLALLGPLALLGSVLGAQALSVGNRRVGGGAAVVAVLCCSYLAWERVGVWASPLAMWKDWAARLYYTAGDPVFVAEQWGAKVRHLEEFLASHPSSAAALNTLGGLYYETGQLGEAIRRLEAAARLEPNRAPIFLNLGRAYARAGDLQSAKRHLKRATELDPYSFVAHLNLARVYLTLADVERARAELEACARIRPTSSGADPYWRREREYLKRLEAAQGRAGGEK